MADQSDTTPQAPASLDSAAAPPQATRNASHAMSEFAGHLCGKPQMGGYIMIGMGVFILILIILVVVFYNQRATKDKFLGTNPLGNLNTGGNNPHWQGGVGDAGWGGTMHSTYQPGESRVYGASAEGGHYESVVPVQAHSCPGLSAHGGAGPGAPGHGGAAEEASVLMALQAHQGGTAKDMDDDDLVRVMNGQY